MSQEAANAPRSSLRLHGRGLVRPECVLAHGSGLLFASDWTGGGGISVLDPREGSVRRHLARAGDARLRPNGILLQEGGSVLLAHLDEREGGVFRLDPDGTHAPVLTEVDGRPLPPTNFLAADDAGRLYVTVSTFRVPRHLSARPDARDGFIVMKPADGPARIVADGIGYTNECALTPDGRTLLVNETFGRATLAYPVGADGALGVPTVLARYGEGIFPDGLALDEEGGVWVVSIISNTVLRVAPGGRVETVLKERDEARVRQVEDAFTAGEVNRALLDAPHAGTLKNVSSLAFGGPDRKTLYLGCLLGDSIASVEVGVAGIAPRHYGASLRGLIDAGVIDDDRQETRNP